MANLLDKAAKKIIRDVLFVSKKDKVLIIIDKKRKRIGDMLFREAAKIAESVLVFTPVAKYDGEEPPKRIGDLMLKYSKIVTPTSHSLTHTKATQRAIKKGAIVVTLPGITEQIMKQSVNISYKRLAQKNKKLHKKLEKVKKIRITTPKGTDLTFKPRTWFMDSGDFRKYHLGNLPAGEVFCAPLEKTSNGVLVIDLAKDDGKVYAPKGTTILIEKGNVVGISRNCELSKIFTSIKNSKNIAEMGIGTNPKAKIIGNILQDEKALKTCHVAFGNNTAMDGKIYSKIHLDVIFFEPTVYGDKKIIMKKGKLNIY